MKKAFILIAIACLGMLSCVPYSINVDDGGDESGATEYYVKYASDALGTTCTISYTDESGKNVHLSNIGGDKFERIVGPVSPGFEASFSVNPNLYSAYVNARIEVKKGNKPFVVKAEGYSSSQGSGVSVKYTVKE